MSSWSILNVQQLLFYVKESNDVGQRSLNRRIKKPRFNRTGVSYYLFTDETKFYFVPEEATLFHPLSSEQP